MEPSLLDRFAGNPGHLLVVVIAGFLTNALIELAKAWAFNRQRKADAKARDLMVCRWNEPNQDWQRKFECVAECDSEIKRKK